jgi:hypothetical protein
VPVHEVRNADRDGLEVCVREQVQRTRRDRSYIHWLVGEPDCGAVPWPSDG